MAADHDISESQSYIEKRNFLLKDVDPAVMRKAWFTLSHLLLDEGAKVADMGCGDGAMTYAMAVMYPKVKFTGIDKNKRDITRAKEQYELHNLDFQFGDVSDEPFAEESLDAIINSFVLHEVYSGSRYNERIVSDTLHRHFFMLKKGGTMFIRDFARPPPEEFVLMELPDEASSGTDLARLSEVDLLIWYSEHARPRQDPGCGGFFLEELPTRFPKKRLFRLPYKWAYEFVMRKDDRAHWEKELPMEYTFFTPREFRKNLQMLGARVNYSGPHWDDDYINEKFEGRFRLYEDDGTPLDNPPTSYVFVSTKMADRKSLHIEERRPSAATEDSKIKITAMRDEQTGQLIDIVRREDQMNEVIPYHVDEEGRLKIYLHDGVARSVGNAVPRSGVNLDGRRWSGHMVEPVSVDTAILPENGEWDVKHTARFARDQLGLKPRNNALLQKGPDYYPAPDYIDERIYTFYLNVERTKSAVIPKSITTIAGRFQARGRIRELDAQQVLDAISVGMIPNARLELQILSLFQHLNIRPEIWSTKNVRFNANKIKQKTSLKSIMANYGTEGSRFKNVKGTAGQLRAVHSIFVEEGQTKGSTTGLSAQDVDFIVHEDQTINTAVVLPLTMGMKKEVHAGFVLKHLPIPQRYEGNSTTISAPSFNLPREITDMKMARRFIAEKFGVLPEMVLKLGESYFAHIGVTPHKIHPFAVIVPDGKPVDPGTKFIPFYQFMLLRRSLGRDPHFMLTIARAYRYFHEEIKLDFSRRVSAIVQQRFDQAKPEWSLPLNYEIAAPAKKPSVPDPDLSRDKDDLDLKISALQQRAKQQAPAIPDGKPATQKTPDMDSGKEFEQELEEFIDILENDMNHKPQPEKW
jgi:hypothetical protein